MLSADVRPLAVANPPPQVSQTLIRMMDSDARQFGQERAILGFAAEVHPPLVRRFARNLLKIHRAVYKFGEALIKESPAEPTHSRAVRSTHRHFLRIRAILSRQVPHAQARLGMSFDSVETNTNQVMGQLAAVGPAPGLSRDDEQVLLKIIEAWRQMDVAAFQLHKKIAFDDMPDERLQESVKARLSDVLMRTARLEDETLRAEITAAVGSAHVALFGTPLPSGTGDVISG